MTPTASRAPRTERSIIRRISSASRPNLTVSGQLNAETYALAFAKVYTFGPTFRAEKSNTPRHAAEFWMMEPEIAFADLDDDMELIESMLKYVVAYIMKECPRELELFDKFIDTTLLDRLHNIVGSDFARVTYTEAIKLLKESGVTFEYPIDWGSDLQTEHERYLTEKVYGRPVFVTDWPRDIKAFYMRVNDDGKTVAAVDLLVPGVGELVGGSQREERLDVLLESIKKFGLDENDYSWYVDLRRYGGAKHAGFGLGFERLIMYVTGIGNIRDVESFPRTTGSADFCILTQKYGFIHIPADASEAVSFLFSDYLKLIFSFAMKFRERPPAAVSRSTSYSSSTFETISSSEVTSGRISHMNAASSLRAKSPLLSRVDFPTGTSMQSPAISLFISSFLISIAILSSQSFFPPKRRSASSSVKR